METKYDREYYEDETEPAPEVPSTLLFDLRFLSVLFDIAVHSRHLLRAVIDNTPRAHIIEDLARELGELELYGHGIPCNLQGFIEAMELRSFALLEDEWDHADLLLDGTHPGGKVLRLSKTPGVNEG